MNQTPVTESWDALYEAQLANYNTVLGNDHNMDAKAGVVLAAIFAVSTFSLTHNLFTKTNRWQFAVLIGGLVFYAIAIALLIIVLFPKGYILPANTTADRPEYLDKSHPELMYQLISDIEASAQQIKNRLKVKSVLFTIGSCLFITGTLLLLVVRLIVVQ